MPVGYRRAFLRLVDIIAKENLAARSHSAKGEIHLGPYVSISPAEIKGGEYQPEFLTRAAMDGIPLSSLEPLPIARDDWGRRFIGDFGPIKTAYGSLVVWDLVTSGEWYESLGRSPNQILTEMGEEALTLAVKLRSLRKP